MFLVLLVKIVDGALGSCCGADSSSRADADKDHAPKGDAAKQQTAAKMTHTRHVASKLSSVAGGGCSISKPLLIASEAGHSYDTTM